MESKQYIGKAAINAALKGQENGTITDTEVRGFHARIANGKVTYGVLREIKVRRDGQVETERARVRIGRHGEWSPDQARLRAIEINQLIDQGIDPREQRDKRLHEMTFGELVDKYLEAVEGSKKTADLDRQRIDANASDWRDVPLSAFTRTMIKERHTLVSKQYPVGANRFIQTCRLIWNWGALEAELPEIKDAPNPFHRQRLNKETARNVLLRPHELPIFWEAIQREENPYLRSLALLVLLSGCRPGEALKIRWERVEGKDCSWIDLERGEWLKAASDTKTGDEQVLPLSSHLRRLFEALPRKEGNPWVFCGQKRGDHIRNYAHAWERLREAAPALKHTNMYDLKDTFATNAEYELKYERPLVKKVLNHTDADVTSRYSHATLTAMRGLMEHTGTLLLALCHGHKLSEEIAPPPRQVIDPRWNLLLTN